MTTTTVPNLGITGHRAYTARATRYSSGRYGAAPSAVIVAKGILESASAKNIEAFASPSNGIIATARRGARAEMGTRTSPAASNAVINGPTTRFAARDTMEMEPNTGTVNGKVAHCAVSVMESCWETILGAPARSIVQATYEQNRLRNNTLAADS